MRHMRIFKLILILLIAFSACGRKGDPQAPEIFAPRAVSAVDIKCDSTAVKLSWVAPRQDKEERAVIQSFFLRRKAIVNNVEGNIEELGTFPANILVNKTNDPQAKYQYEDKQVSNGTSYKYYLSAVDLDGLEGAIDVVYKVNFTQGACIVEPLSFTK